MIKHNLRNIEVILQDNLDDDRSSKYFYNSIPLLALDIIESEIFKPMIFKSKHLLTFVKFPFQIKVWNSLMYPIFFMIHQ